MQPDTDSNAAHPIPPIPPLPSSAPRPATRRRGWILPVATGIAGLAAGSALTFALTNTAAPTDQTAATQITTEPMPTTDTSPPAHAAPHSEPPARPAAEEITVNDQSMPLAANHQQLKKGQAATTARWTIAINSVQFNAPETNEYIKADLDKEGKRKGVLAVSITNNTNRSMKFDNGNLELLYVLDQDDNTSRPHGLIESARNDVFEKNVKPGATVEGFLQFDYYDDATEFRALVCEPGTQANNFHGEVVATISMN